MHSGNAVNLMHAMSRFTNAVCRLHNPLISFYIGMDMQNYDMKGYHTSINNMMALHKTFIEKIDRQVCEICRHIDCGNGFCNDHYSSVLVRFTQ